jgi:hypothetical protein
MTPTRVSRGDGPGQGWIRITGCLGANAQFEAQAIGPDKDGRLARRQHFQGGIPQCQRFDIHGSGMQPPAGAAGQTDGDADLFGHCVGDFRKQAVSEAPARHIPGQTSLHGQNSQAERPRRIAFKLGATTLFSRRRPASPRANGMISPSCPGTHIGHPHVFVALW